MKPLSSNRRAQVAPFKEIALPRRKTGTPRSGAVTPPLGSKGIGQFAQRPINPCSQVRPRRYQPPAFAVEYGVSQSLDIERQRWHTNLRRVHHRDSPSVGHRRMHRQPGSCQQPSLGRLVAPSMQPDGVTEPELVYQLLQPGGNRAVPDDFDSQIWPANSDGCSRMQQKFEAPVRYQAAKGDDVRHPGSADGRMVFPPLAGEHVQRWHVLSVVCLEPDR